MSTYERPQWRRAALALLALSLLSSAAFSALLGYERSRSAALREQVRQAEHIRDLAVEELGAVSLASTREKQARAEQAASYEAVGIIKFM